MLHCLRHFKRTNNILNFPICHSVVTCSGKFNYLYGERFKLLTMPDPKETPPDPRKDKPQNRVQSDGDEKSLKPVIKKRKPKKK